MARFVSPEWITALSAAAADADLPEPVTADALTVRHVVRGGPEGDVAFWVRLAGGRAEAGPGDDIEADVVLTSDYDTAAAMAQGELLAREALLSGRLHVRGQPGRLTRHAAGLAALDAALAGLRSQTVY